MGNKSITPYTTAGAFLAHFPVGTQFSVAAFDKWAENMQHYDLGAEPMTINHERAILVKKINAGALSKAWMKSGNAAFCIMVESKGQLYSVQKAHDAQQRKSLALPKEIKSIVYTKHGAIQRIAKSVEKHLLPEEIRYTLDRTDRMIEFMVETIEFNMRHVNLEIKSLKSDMARAVAKNPTLATQAVVDLLLSNGDGETAELLQIAKLDHLIPTEEHEDEDGE